MRVLYVLLSIVASVAAQSVLRQAEQAHQRGQLAVEEALLRNGADTGSTDERAEAERRLAWLQWRFYKKYDAARTHFERAEALKHRLPDTLSARARMEIALKRFEDARSLSRRALESAAGPREREDAITGFGSATVEEAFETGKSAAAPEGLELLSSLVRAEPGKFLPSRLMYGLAMLLGDAPRAGEALRSYYWGGSPRPLYPEAGLAAKPAEVVTYSRFCRRVAEIANEHYRLRALGEAQWHELKPQVLAVAGKFYPGLTSEEALLDHFSRGFGAEIAFFRFGLEFGHRIRDDEVNYDQHGRKGTVRAVVVDSMVSNGYTTWYSGGTEVIGGWADNPIIRVRNDNAFRAWIGFTDSARKAEIEARIAKASTQDDEIARRDPYAYLEGLATRIALRVNRDLFAGLQAKGLSGTELRLGFLFEWDRQQDACVYAHEARHLIDGPSAPFNREMTAALSSVLFSGYPRAALRAIIGPNIARRDGGSGEGNWRIMQGIVAWMEKHTNEIKGLDRSRPLLPQFDLLTTDQIRDAFLAMDPSAQPAGASGPPRS